MTSTFRAFGFPIAASNMRLYFSSSSSLRGTYSLVTVPSGAVISLYVPSTTADTEIPFIFDGDLIMCSTVLLISCFSRNASLLLEDFYNVFTDDRGTSECLEQVARQRYDNCLTVFKLTERR